MKTSPGYYTLTHVPTGLLYIGSTANLSNRLSHHRWVLKKGSHGNHRWQAAYTAWDDIRVETFVTDTVELARTGEQELLFNNRENPLCCNIGTSATDPSKGILTFASRGAGGSVGGTRTRGIPKTELHRKRIGEGRKGKIHSEESKAAISASRSASLLIDGVRYESAKLAGEALGLDPRFVRYRVISPLYPEWKRD